MSGAGLLALTDEQEDLRELAHQFAAKEIRPVAAACDREARLPLEVLVKAWELGLMNLNLPSEYGGPGLGGVENCLISEEIAWGCSGIATSMFNNELAMIPVVLGGSDELKRRTLPRFADAPVLASFCLTEPGAGSDAAAIRTRAVRRGAAYVLNGSKCFITNGSHSEWFTVFAKTNPEAGHRGISAFVVPRDAGVVVDKKEDKLGQRASDTVSLTFDDVEIPATNLIGEENEGFKLAMAALDLARAPIAASATGIARAAFEHACDYARERETFGVPIAMHQAIQFMIADMATEIEAARLLAWQAAAKIDRGERATLESSHAKRFAADIAMKVTVDAVQVYGGYGFIRDYPVEKLMRDAKIMQLYEGTSQIQRLVIARETLRTKRPAQTAAA